MTNLVRVSVAIDISQTLGEKRSAFDCGEPLDRRLLQQVMISVSRLSL